MNDMADNEIPVDLVTRVGGYGGPRQRVWVTPKEAADLVAANVAVAVKPPPPPTDDAPPRKASASKPPAPKQAAKPVVEATEPDPGDKK